MSAGETPDRASIKASKIRRKLLAWFGEHGRPFPWRHPKHGAFEAILAEMLLQRTRAETVASFFTVFLVRFPTWEALAEASEDEIGQFLKPIGLWRRRAASMAALSKAMVARQGVFPETREEIESLPGVGQYIANAILMFVHGKPEPLLDVNMARVLERVFGPRKLADIRYDPYLQNLSREVIRGKHAAELNWAILDLAAKVCTISKPKCEICPIAGLCKFAQDRRETSDGGSPPFRASNPLL
jgi:A/G-specific adenine glycosylase